MKRGTIFIVLFILIAAGIIGASRFLGAQPPLEYTVAVDPLVVPWVQEAVNALNASEPVVNTRRIRFTVTPVDDLDVWQERRAWTTNDHPAAWIAASTASVQYALNNGLPFAVAASSLARTPLVWGGFSSQVDVATGGSAALDWPQVAAAAQAESWANIGGQTDWGFVDLAFAQPDRKIGGLAALLTGAASYNQTTVLTGNLLRSREFRDWMLPVIKSVPNFATLGSDPAAAMAARGISVGEIALLPEVLWLNNLNGLRSSGGVRFSYPAYQFVLDFPLARWQMAQTPVEELGAVDILKDWLLTPAQQTQAFAFGLRAAADEPTQANALFAAGEPFGIQLTPNYGQAVQAPPLADTQGLIQWFVSSQ